LYHAAPYPQIAVSHFPSNSLAYALPTCFKRVPHRIHALGCVISVLSRYPSLRGWECISRLVNHAACAA
jgi:hypothetical protein